MELARPVALNYESMSICRWRGRAGTLAVATGFRRDRETRASSDSRSTDRASFVYLPPEQILQPLIDGVVERQLFGEVADGYNGRDHPGPWSRQRLVEPGSWNHHFKSSSKAARSMLRRRGALWCTSSAMNRRRVRPRRGIANERIGDERHGPCRGRDRAGRVPRQRLAGRAHRRPRHDQWVRARQLRRPVTAVYREFGPSW